MVYPDMVFAQFKNQEANELDGAFTQRISNLQSAVQKLINGVCIFDHQFTQGFNCKIEALNPRVLCICDEVIKINRSNVMQMAGRGARDGGEPQLDILFVHPIT